MNALHDFLPLPGSGRTPESVADELERRIATRLGQYPAVAWDASYRRLLPFAPALAPYFLAVEERLAARFGVREFDHPDWPVLVYGSRAGEPDRAAAPAAGGSDSD